MQPKTALHNQDEIIFIVFCVDYCAVAYRMHSEAEFCWSHVQNAFRSRISWSQFHLEVIH